MAASFSTIKAPPQTLERLDRWGMLDSLPWSLDDSVWSTAGEYALTLSETGKSGQTASFVRKKVITLKGTATATQSSVWASVVLLSGSGTTKAGEQVEAERLRPLYASLSGNCSSAGAVSAIRIRVAKEEGAAACLEKISYVRIRQAALMENAATSEALSPVRARLISGNGTTACGQDAIYFRVRPFLETVSALSAEGILPYRVRTTGLSGLAAKASEKEEPNRIRCVVPAPSNGKAESVISPEYKGWGWTELARRDVIWTGVVQWQ